MFSVIKNEDISEMYREDVHNLIQVDPFRRDAGSPAPGRAPRIPRAPRARTAPPRHTENTPDTQRFLRKNHSSRQPPVIDRKEYRCVLEAPRPPLPKLVRQHPVQKVSKNFVRENVRKVEKMEVKISQPCTVVSCKGERQDLSPFLESRRMVESASFGRVPKYLAAKKKAWQQEKTARESQEKRDSENKSEKYLPVADEEKKSILQGLKERWLDLHKEFLLLPVFCDTVPKVKRKVRLETELKELEKDIDLLERNPFIYLEK